MKGYSETLDLHVNSLKCVYLLEEYCLQYCLCINYYEPNCSFIYKEKKLINTGLWEGRLYLNIYCVKYYDRPGNSINNSKCYYWTLYFCICECLRGKQWENLCKACCELCSSIWLNPKWLVLMNDSEIHWLLEIYILRLMLESQL